MIINFFLKLLGLRDSFFLTTSPSPPAAQPRFVCALGLLVLELREKGFFYGRCPCAMGRLGAGGKGCSAMPCVVQKNGIWLFSGQVVSLELLSFWDAQTQQQDVKYLRPDKALGFQP